LGKAFGRGNYNTWPLINTKNVRKYFPESEETQLGHMQGQRQGVRSNRPKQPVNSSPNLSIKKSMIICARIQIEPRGLPDDNIYANQTGDFPYISS
jgi:hypothetical protein